ncbi:MAG: hypothetical protein JWN98_1176 [Abditibacteriota bacterium]|nr:hypothetical protein [Abditibacteriota bacterium]
MKPEMLEPISHILDVLLVADQFIEQFYPYLTAHSSRKFSPGSGGA